MRDES